MRASLIRMMALLVSAWTSVSSSSRCSASRSARSSVAAAGSASPRSTSMRPSWRERGRQLAARSGLVERRQRRLQPRSRFVETAFTEVDVGEGDADARRPRARPLAFVEPECLFEPLSCLGRVARPVGERAGPRKQLCLQRRLVGCKRGRLIEVVLAPRERPSAAARSAAERAPPRRAPHVVRVRIVGGGFGGGEQVRRDHLGHFLLDPGEALTSAATAARWRALRSLRDSVS